MGRINQRYITLALTLSPVLVGFLLFLVFDFTDPVKLGSWGILGVFTLIYLLFLSITFVVLRFGIYWTTKLLASRKVPYVTKPVGVGQRKAYYIASVVAFAPVTLLAMYAASSLQFTDVALLIFFVGIVTFYIVKRQ